MNIIEILAQFYKTYQIINYFLLILPVLFLLFNQKYLYCLYVISIVSNLPLIFINYFSFSYELYLGILIILAIIKHLIFNREITFKFNKESLLLILFIGLILISHLGFSIINFNKREYFQTIYAYLSNLFILFIFLYFIKNSYYKNLVIKSFFIGTFILACSVVLELFYNYYRLNIIHGRYGGLIIDPNGAAFVLNIGFLLSFYKERYFVSFNLFIRVIFRIVIFMSIIFTVSRSGIIILTFITLAILAYYIASKEAYKVYITVGMISLGVLFFRQNVISFVMELMKMVDLKRLRELLIIPDSNISPPSDNIPPVIIDPTTSGRLQLFLNSLVIIRQNLLFGVGIGNVPWYIDPINLQNSHNLWLQLILESGILMSISLVIFCIYLLIYIFNKGFKNKTIFVITLIAFLIESFFNHNLLKLNLTFLVLAIIISSNILSKEHRIKINLVLPLKIYKENQVLLKAHNLEQKDYQYEFSIITPTYNRAKIIPNLYNSLVKQTLNNFEWIVINDGSIDNTNEIIKSFASENKFKITLINQENLGKHIAVNKGLKIARGKYVVIVDADDYLKEDALEKYLKMFKKALQKEKFICGVGGLKADENNQIIGTFPRFTNNIIANNIERERLRLSLDKAECFYRDILQEYYFPVFENEKFLTERILWDKLASDGYYIAYYRDITYICKYLDDGLTSKGVLKFIDNPLGYAYFISSVIRYDYPISKRIYHLGSYVNIMQKYYDVTIKDLAIACNGNKFELWGYSKIHRVLKSLVRKKNKDERQE